MREGRGGGYVFARRATFSLLVVSTLIVLAGGAKTWGHNPWSAEAFRIEVPPAAQGTAVIVGGNPPWAWLAAGFPREVAFTQTGGNCPEGPGFRDRILRIVRSNGGAAHAIVTGHHDSSADRAARIATTLDWLGLTRSAWGCSTLRWAVRTFKARAEVKPIALSEGCEVKAVTSQSRDVGMENRLEWEKAAAIVKTYGFTLGDVCSVHRARLGGATRAYQWCPLSPPAH